MRTPTLKFSRLEAKNSDYAQRKKNRGLRVQCLFFFLSTFLPRGCISYKRKEWQTLTFFFTKPEIVTETSSIRFQDSVVSLLFVQTFPRGWTTSSHAVWSLRGLLLISLASRHHHLASHQPGMEAQTQTPWRETPKMVLHVSVTRQKSQFQPWERQLQNMFGTGEIFLMTCIHCFTDTSALRFKAEMKTRCSFASFCRDVHVLCNCTSVWSTGVVEKTTQQRAARNEP